MQIFRHELKLVYISKHEILSLYADFLTIKSYLRHVILDQALKFKRNISIYQVRLWFNLQDELSFHCLCFVKRNVKPKKNESKLRCYLIFLIFKT